MKKILVILVAVTAIAATSCKKDSEVKPSAVKAQKVMGGERDNTGTYD